MSRGNMNRLGGASTAEAFQDPVQLWQSAYAGADFLGSKSYLVQLALRDDPTTRIYATLEMGSTGLRIDVPLEEPTTEEQIRSNVNLHPTLWGDIDPEGRREATDTYAKERLLAALNKASTGATSPRHVPGRFYEMLRIKHGETYGYIRVSSHGGSSTFSAELEPTPRQLHGDLRDLPKGMQLDAAVGFAQFVEASLPHLTITPLPVDAYLEDAQTTLGYVPRD